MVQFLCFPVTSFMFREFKQVFKKYVSNRGERRRIGKEEEREKEDRIKNLVISVTLFFLIIPFLSFLQTLRRE